MKIFRTIMVASVLVTKTMSASTANADHDARYALISSHAEEIVSASRDLNDELRFRFHDSRRYGDLLATNARIRSKANDLRAQARPSRNGANIARFLAELDEQVCRMEALIDDARVRAARGIDPWLGSTRAATAYVAQMRDAIRCMQREMSTWNLPPVVVPHEGFTPVYPGGGRHDRGAGYGRRYDSGFGRGSGTSTWSGPGSDRGIHVDRDGITLSTGGLSVHFNR